MSSMSMWLVSHISSTSHEVHDGAFSPRMDTLYGMAMKRSEWRSLRHDILHWKLSMQDVMRSFRHVAPGFAKSASTKKVQHMWTGNFSSAEEASHPSADPPLPWPRGPWLAVGWKRG